MRFKRDNTTQAFVFIVFLSLFTLTQAKADSP